jgi:Ni/Co efflux regulator RcnB
MTKILQLLFIAIAFALAAAPAVSFAEGAVVVSESISAKATIVKVNKKTRELTLRDEQGHEETVVASKDVRNFNQIKKGDVLEVEYHHAAASALEKVDNTTMAGESTDVKRAKAGEKPGMMAVHTKTIVATVIDVDTQNRLLSVKGPKGRVVTVEVPADMKAFDSLKKGDKISAEYAEAVAISVKKPEKKK